MLALSSSVHTGFMLLALNSSSAFAYAAFALYSMAYNALALAFALLFGALQPINRLLLNASVRISSRYLWQYSSVALLNPAYMFALVLLLCSLIGLPPSVGFHMKLLVLFCLLAQSYALLAYIAALLKVLSATYYIRLLAQWLLASLGSLLLCSCSMPSRGSAIIIAAFALLSFVLHYRLALVSSSLLY